MVIDTSAIVAVIGNAPEKNQLIERTTGEDLIAPQSVHWEVGNALSAMFKRRQISLADALEALTNYEQITLRLVDVSLSDALQWSERMRIYAHDAYLIVAALRYRSPILTLDRGLSAAARRGGVDVVEI